MKFKIKFFHLGGLIILLAIASCAGGNKRDGEQEKLKGLTENNGSTQMHKQHNILADNFAHKNIVILNEVYRVNEQTQSELEEVIDAYLLMKDALVNDDVVATDKAISVMNGKIKEVKPEKLDGEGLEAWEDHLRLYNDKLQEMRHVEGLESKRSYFSHISEIMYCTIKSFRLKQGDLYAVYCSNAIDDAGAYWISNTMDIKNPYTGMKVAPCGEIKELL